jgi:hypothetical protein
MFFREPQLRAVLGPDLTAGQRNELAVTECLAGLALRETYPTGMERAAQRRTAEEGG